MNACNGSSSPRRTSQLAAITCALMLQGCGLWHGAIAPLQAASARATCTRVPGFPEGMGAEDLAPDPKSGGVYVSAADWAGLARYEGGMAQPPRTGSIYFVELAPDRSIVARDRMPMGGRAFFPHGLDVWRPSKDGATGRLFVVNHGRGAGPSQIDILDIDANGDLRWSDDRPGPIAALKRPNDVTGVGPDAFYTSNDHRSSRRSWFGIDPIAISEDLVAARSAAVFYVGGANDPAKSTSAAFPNGVEASSDGRRLFVSESTRGIVREFAIGPAGDLTELRTFEVPRLTDNIYLQNDRYLWAVAHRSNLDFAFHARGWRDPAGSSKPSRSRVFRLDLASRETKAIPIYETSKGGIESKVEMSAISSAVPIADGFLVGSIFEGLQFCRLASDTIAKIAITP